MHVKQSPKYWVSDISVPDQEVEVVETPLGEAPPREPPQVLQREPRPGLQQVQLPEPQRELQHEPQHEPQHELLLEDVLPDDALGPQQQMEEIIDDEE